MLQCEGAEDLQRLLEDYHKHKKGKPGLGCRLDITPVHMPFDSSLGTFLLAETTGEAFVVWDVTGARTARLKLFFLASFSPRVSIFSSVNVPASKWLEPPDGGDPSSIPKGVTLPDDVDPLVWPCP